MRTRLTLLYALVFLVAGASLLTLTYALLASRLPGPRAAAQKSLTDPHLLALCKAQPAGKTKRSVNTLPAGLVAKCRQAFAAGARAATQNQRAATLHSLLVASLIGLGAITVLSAALGWLLAGRALRPVRAITNAARAASALHLGDRIALRGPQDELKELADTFDEMLERLDQAFASQRRFVANAAHELRTPLTAMQTSIEVTLSKPTRSADQLEAMASKVRRSLQRAEATIDALLALATSEQGAATHELVDLATATEDALDAACASIAEHKLTIDATLAPAQLNGDPVLLERMIANLVDNAVRHNAPDGWIQVSTGERDGAAAFDIANSGPHVPEEIIPALFEPFSRAERRLNPTKGVGLGLAIAQAIGLAHGAGIIAHSRPEGGLEVSIALPQHADGEPAD